MAKRFVTTEIFKDAWFMDLPSKYKLFWFFLISDCSHAGIWQVNYKVASFYVGDHLEPAECERILKDRIINLQSGKYWFIPKFIEFQYGTKLSKTNKALIKVIETLVENDLLQYLPKVTINEGASKGLSSSLEGAEEKEKDKEEEKEKEKYAEFVKMTKKEYEKLVERYGEENTKKMISKLDNYKGSNGKKYKSDYRAMLSWVADEVVKNETKTLELNV